ncbi:MAG: helix-turn-helix domain-containing protein [Caulobacteraceae bacterium]
MAPLDTGAVTHILRLADPLGRGPGPSASGFATLGAYLRAVREHKELSLAQVAEATRIRKVYLVAIEADDITPLPSRPFAVGYVRTYAKALGLDGDAAAARFKAEQPEPYEPRLRAPVGVANERDPRRRVIYAGLGVLCAAVALWNVGQRTLTSAQVAGPIFPAAAQTTPDAPVRGALVLGAPTAPPADQTVPKPYVTPGIGVPGIDPNAAQDAPPQDAAAPAAATPSPVAFTTRATVYGLQAKSGGVVVQAKTAGSLIVRGPDGSVYFARLLKPGEAYRAPLGRGLTADVSDPAAFDVYLNGQLQGALVDPQTPLDKTDQLAAARAKAAAKPPEGAAPV